MNSHILQSLNTFLACWIMISKIEKRNKKFWTEKHAMSDENHRNSWLQNIDKHLDIDWTLNIFGAMFIKQVIYLRKVRCVDFLVSTQWLILFQLQLVKNLSVNTGLYLTFRQCCYCFDCKLWLLLIQNHVRLAAIDSFQAFEHKYLKWLCCFIGIWADNLFLDWSLI